jgi:hypothetical protein
MATLKNAESWSACAAPNRNTTIAKAKIRAIAESDTTGIKLSARKHGFASCKRYCSGDGKDEESFFQKSIFHFNKGLLGWLMLLVLNILQI